MAVMAALDGNVRSAFLWILGGAAFDFCDGLSARLLHAYSPVGKELDSLADLVTFGLAPALLCMGMLRQFCWPCEYIPYSALILVAFAALRLAKFNLDERQATSFLGLAVPANALFWCGTALWVQDIHGPAFIAWILLALIIVFALLMVSELPMFSLKFKNLRWSDNSIRFIFLAGVIALILIFGLKGTAPAIVWYILLSVVTCRK